MVLSILPIHIVFRRCAHVILVSNNSSNGLQDVLYRHYFDAFAAKCKLMVYVLVFASVIHSELHVACGSTVAHAAVAKEGLPSRLWH